MAPKSFGGADAPPPLGCGELSTLKYASSVDGLPCCIWLLLVWVHALDLHK